MITNTYYKTVDSLLQLTGSRIYSDLQQKHTNNGQLHRLADLEEEKSK